MTKTKTPGKFSGARLRAIVAERGVAIAELARRLELSPSRETLFRFFAGTGEPRADDLSRICRVLAGDSDELTMLMFNDIMGFEAPREYGRLTCHD